MARPAFFKNPVSVPKASRVEAIAHLRKADEDGTREVTQRTAPAEPLLTLFYTTPGRN